MEKNSWPYSLPEPHNNMQRFANSALLESGNPYLIHKEGSPYLGLPLEKQKVLAKIRRGGTRTKKALLKRMRKATNEDYTAIMLKCIEALLVAWIDNTKRLDRVHIILRLPFNFRSRIANKDFPRITIIGYDDWTIVACVRVDNMVNYLYKQGKCPYDSRELRKNLWHIMHEQQRMLWFYEYAAPVSIVEEYFNIINNNKEPTDRKNKGRKVSKYRNRKAKENKNEV